MNAKLPHNTVNKDDVIRLIINEINKNPEKGYEVSSTALAKIYGVQGPTMDYHLTKLLEEGIFELSPIKGKYKRKIFLEPKDGYPKSILNRLGIKKEIPKEEKPLINDLDKFRQIVASKLKEESVESKTIATSENKDETVQENHLQEIKEADEIHFTAPPLTLSDQIQMFINKSKAIESADTIISKSDKEVLSVMTESIQQSMVYLKDLSNQLELMENLTLLHQIIEERNQMISEMEQLRKEHSEIIKQKTEQSEQVSVDPSRVRAMHQIIINTLDTFVELPNHAMALQRIEFRDQMTKEIADLANYIVGVDK